ncbi:hypothetical protein AAVH_40726, partial [Aphelenchoides avenae]
PTNVPHYNLRHDKELEQLTDARTIEELRTEITNEYLQALPKWNQQAHNGDRPPYAFSDAWYKEDFSAPFASKFKKLQRIVIARQVEDLVKNRASGLPTEPMDVAEPAAAASAAIALDDGDLVDPDELLGEALQAKATINSVPPPSTAPSTKPKTASTDATHSVAPKENPKTHKGSKERKTVASIKKRSEKSPPRSRQSSAGSKRSHEPTTSSCPPPTKEARRISPPRARSVSPNMARHRMRVANTHRRELVPLLDGFVSKDMAIYTFLAGHLQLPWTREALDKKNPYELLGLINHLGVPASYLFVDFCRSRRAGTHTPLGNQTYDQLRIEQTIIPWDFILGSTMGALPTYWRQCTNKTRKHIQRSLEKSHKYRDMNICGIGPTGFDLRGVAPTDVKEYQQQRLNLGRFARAAQKTRLGLVIVIFHDKDRDPSNPASIHADAINTLLEEGISYDQPIHLIFNHASAIELMLWLEEFPRTIIGLNLSFITTVHDIMKQPDPNPEDLEYAQAYAMKDLLTYVPLESLALHSGCPEPIGPIANRRHRSPLDLLDAATEFQQMTGTPTDALHANNARNLVHFYRLDHRLLDRSVSRQEHRDAAIGPRLSLDDLSDRIRAIYPGSSRGPRAAQRSKVQQKTTGKPLSAPFPLTTSQGLLPLIAPRPHSQRTFTFPQRTLTP